MLAATHGHVERGVHGVARRAIQLGPRAGSGIELAGTAAIGGAPEERQAPEPQHVDGQDLISDSDVLGVDLEATAVLRLDVLAELLEEAYADEGSWRFL